MDGSISKIAIEVSLDDSKILFVEVLKHVRLFSVEITFTGDPVGELIFEGSVSGENWFPMETVEQITEATTKFFKWEEYPVSYFRARYNRTSGSGTCNAWGFSKSEQ